MVKNFLVTSSGLGHCLGASLAETDAMAITDSLQ